MPTENGGEAIPDLIELGRGKMEDLLVMSWALRRYSMAERRLQGRMDEAWFGDSTLRRWLESGDEELLRDLLDALPAGRFSGFASSIAERMDGWKWLPYECAVSCLLEISPESLIQPFDEAVARDPVNSSRLELIASCLDSLPMPARLELLQALANRLPDVGNEDSGNLILSRLLRPALKLGPDVLSQVLEAASFPDAFHPNLMASFCEALLGDADLFLDAMSMTAEDPSAAFSERRPFFDAAAPLEECDRALASAISPADALDLLERHRPGPPVADHVRRFLPQMLAPRDATEQDAACLAVAAVLDAYELRRIDAGSLGLRETLRLLALDVYRNPHVEALTDRLRDFDPGEVAAGTRAAMDLTGPEEGALRLVRMAGALGLVELVPDLIGWADRDAADSVISEAEAALALFGEPAVRAVTEEWDGLDFMQRPMGLRVLERVGGWRALDFALARHEEMFGDRQGRQDWCALVEAAPDGRAIDLLARHVHRKQREIDESYCTLCVLTGREPENLPEVRQRVLEERRRRNALTMGEAFGHVAAELACGECGDTNVYEVRDIVVSDADDSGPFVFVREEFPCASCGKWPDFEIQPSGEFALMAAARRYDAGLMPDMRVSDLDISYLGRMRSAAAVVEKLGAALKSDPRSVVNLLRMARVQYSLGRFARASRFYDKAWEIEPASMEAGLGVARITAGLGSAREALDLLSDLQENEAKWRFFRVDEVSPRTLRGEFARLRRRLRSALGEPVSAADFLGSEGRRKTGRNEPCPCGSGEKYKKCCMRVER